MADVLWPRNAVVAEEDNRQVGRDFGEQRYRAEESKESRAEQNREIFPIPLPRHTLPSSDPSTHASLAA